MADAAFSETSLEFWRETFAINVEGTFNVCAATVPELARSGGGAIVNFSSLAVVRPPKIPSAAYAASKGAVLAFSKAIAAELGPQKIRVNCIVPGAIETPMLTERVTAAQLAAYSTQSSLGRLGQPKEVAEVVAFLVSEQASLVHGAAIEVAGL